MRRNKSAELLFVALMTCAIVPMERSDQLMLIQEMPNDFLVMSYDTNQDGRMDFRTARRRYEWGDWRKDPLYYRLDLNHDGTPDVTYQDYSEEGRCQSIQESHTG